MGRMSMDYRRFEIADLTGFKVSMKELRLASNRTWLYALCVQCNGMEWEIIKRYSEIRCFWNQLCLLLNTTSTTCTEKCHFLMGFQNDKFPKKRLLHTRSVLEARANEFDVFFNKLVMRLTLCNPRELSKCHLRGCPILTLLSSFFDVQEQYPTSIYDHLRSYRSLPLVKNRTKDGRQTYDGRLSLSGLEELRVV